MPARGVVQGATGVVEEVDLALEVPRWAARFYLRHLAVVVGISLVPATQRAVGQLWGERLPGALNVGLELVTMASRVLLVVVVFRLAILAEERLRGVSGSEGMRRVVRFTRRHWGSLLVQAGMLVVAFVMLDRIPEAVIAPRISESWRRVYWAALLATKNLTIIALTLIWEIGLLRQMLLHEDGSDRETRGPSRRRT